MLRGVVIVLLVCMMIVSGSEAKGIYCGDQHCQDYEVCCNANDTPICMKKDTCDKYHANDCEVEGKELCGQTCVNLASDPIHGGTCGTSCEGLCSYGACVPVSVQVVRSNLTPLDLKVAVSADYILASSNGNPAFELRRRVSNVTVQVVKTGITPQLATAARLREAETELLHPIGRLHTRWSGTPRCCAAEVVKISVYSMIKFFDLDVSPA